MSRYVCTYVQLAWWPNWPAGGATERKHELSLKRPASNLSFGPQPPDEVLRVAVARAALAHHHVIAALRDGAAAKGRHQALVTQQFREERQAADGNPVACHGRGDHVGVMREAHG